MCLKLFCLSDPWCSEWGCCKSDSNMDCTGVVLVSTLAKSEWGCCKCDGDMDSGRCSTCSHFSKIDRFLENMSFALMIMMSHPGKYEYCSADPAKYSSYSSVKPFVSKAS